MAQCKTCGKKIEEGKSYCSLKCYYNRNKKKALAAGPVLYVDFDHLSEETKENIKRLLERTKATRAHLVSISKLKRINNIKAFRRFAEEAREDVLREFLMATRFDRRYSGKRKIVEEILKQRNI